MKMSSLHIFVLVVAVAVSMLALSSPAVAAAYAAAYAADNIAAFSMPQANTSVWLSAATFCEKSTYLSRSFEGPTKGFIATYVIHEDVTDVTGFIGYLPSDKSIYVVFRGSSSIPNWIADLDVIKTAYTSFPECNCQVHKGFYSSEQRVISNVVSEVKRLQALKEGYQVKVTGHSLGAAIAQLTSMDLLKFGIPNSLYNFGQPRTGDKAYSDFATPKVSAWRVVHYKDQVPHMPFTTGMDYYHICREEFEDVNGSVKSCDSSCEDPTCAAQYTFLETNGDDHMTYLGLYMDCKSVS